MATREEVMAMVIKLRAHAEGGRTVPEQAVFAAKVRDLMDRYRISEAELSGMKNDGSAMIGSAMWIGGPSWSRHHVLVYLPQMAVIIGTAYACRVVMVEGRAKAHFIGRESDRTVAVFMMDYLSRKGVELAHVAQRLDRQVNPGADRSTYEKDFLHGYVCCLSECYDARRAQTIGELVLEGNEQALIRLSQELVAADRFLARGEIPVDGQGRAGSRADNMNAAYDGVAAGLDQVLDTNGINGSTGTPHQQIEKGRRA